MIDFIKTYHPYMEPELWLNNDFLRFNRQFNGQTGEIFNYFSPASYNGLKFQIKPKKSRNGYSCFLDGSLHKFFNNGTHNANQFSFQNLKDTIEALSYKFELKPRYTAIRSIEIGLNIELPFSPQEFFKQALFYKNRIFCQIDKASKDTGITCCFSEYELKIYDKHLQNNSLPRTEETGSNLLRFEVKIKKMRRLKQYGIKTMADLLDIEKMQSLKEILLTALDKIIFIDYYLDSSCMSGTERERFSRFRNPLFWSESTKSQLARNRRLLEALMSKYSTRQIKHQLREAILLHWDGLFKYVA